MRLSAPSAETRRRGLATSLALGVVLALFLTAATGYNLLHPIWEAPDEANHYAFIRHLVERRSLPPVVPFWSDRLGGETEAHQPPLYYAVQALLVGWVDDETEAEWHRNPYATWPDHPARFAIALHRADEAFPFDGYVLGVHLARLLSSLLGAGTVLFTFLTARIVTRSSSTAVLAAALAAFTPGFAFISGTVNNDNAVAFVGAFTIWHCVRLVRAERIRPRDGIVSGLLLGGAALSKLTGLLLLPLVGATYLLIFWRKRRDQTGEELAAALLATVSFLALFAWWPIVMREDWAQIQVNSSNNFPAFGLLPPASGYNLIVLRDGLVGMFTSYWGRFGWADELNLPVWANLAIGAVCVLALLGLGRAVYRSRHSAFGWQRAAPAMLAGFVLLSVYLLLNRYQLLPEGHVMQGRYLYMAMPAIATALAVGLREVAGRLSLATVVPVALLAALTFAVPFTISRDAFASPYPVWAVFDEAQVRTRLDLNYGRRLTYLGFSGEQGDLRPGESLTFTSYWRAETDLGKDVLAAYRLVDPTGEAPASDHQVPQVATFPPRLWQRGEVVPDNRTLTLPKDALPGAYRLQLRLLDESAVVDVPRVADSGEVSGWVDLARLRVRPAGNLKPSRLLAGSPATFGDLLTVQGYDTELSGVGGERRLNVTLYWRATRQPEADYHVSVQLLDGQGTLRAQHDGIPHGGAYPTSRWEPGETVPDRHELTVPADLTGGKIVVVVYNPTNSNRLNVAGAAFLSLADLQVLDR